MLLANFLCFYVSENFKENKKTFWKRVNEVRKWEIQRMVSVKDSTGEELINLGG